MIDIIVFYNNGLISFHCPIFSIILPGESKIKLKIIEREELFRKIIYSTLFLHDNAHNIVDNSKVNYLISNFINSHKLCLLSMFLTFNVKEIEKIRILFPFGTTSCNIIHITHFNKIYIFYYILNFTLFSIYFFHT